MVAGIHMAPKLSRAADLYGPHGTSMPHRQLMGLPVDRSIGPKDIGHFKEASHQKPSL